MDFRTIRRVLDHVEAEVRRAAHQPGSHHHSVVTPEMGSTSAVDAINASVQAEVDGLYVYDVFSTAVVVGSNWESGAPLIEYRIVLGDHIVASEYLA